MARATAAFTRFRGDMLLQPVARKKAGLGAILIMILVLIPCAAAAVFRFGNKR